MEKYYYFFYGIDSGPSAGVWMNKFENTDKGSSYYLWQKPAEDCSDDDLIDCFRYIKNQSNYNAQWKQIHGKTHFEHCKEILPESKKYIIHILEFIDL